MSSENRLFKTHKSRILAEIESPIPDASPKGSIDVQILPLINRLNQHDRIFTTSSCSGRVSVFFEGLKKIATTTGKTPVGDAVGNAGIGGKGEGGKWLFVSHDPVDTERKSDCEVAEMLLGKEVDEVAATPDEQRLGYVGLGSGDAVGFDISSATRFVHLKFEPMVCKLVPHWFQYANKNSQDSTHSNFRSRNCSYHSRRSTVGRLPRIGNNESWSRGIFIPHGCDTL